MLRVVTDDDARAELAVGLDEIVREGARRMLAAALEAEVDAYIEALAGELDERAAGWWSATATPSRARSRPARAGSRSRRRG